MVLQTTRPPIAFVVPWYGADIPGGAETECRKTAEQLQQRGHPVVVLTTCGLQFHSDWGKNYHRPGLTRINGVTVRRFTVRPRDRHRFHAINLRLMRGVPISAADEAAFMAEMINSDDLCAFIAAHRDDYRFIFIPYMFGTTYWGAQIAPRNSFIVPCLHDEPYAHMTLLKPVMQSVRGLVLHSPAERELARALFDIPDARLHLLGEGVDTQLAPNPSAFRKPYNICEPYIIYVGRRDETKNTPLLLEYFARFKAQHGGDLKLVLIGSGPLPDVARARADILDAGVVGEQVKIDALAGALGLCNPSLRESFSLQVMESWAVGRPVLVHADCAVTVGHCQASHGGLWFKDYAEFAATVCWLRDHPSEATAMGAQGRQYVQQNFMWDRIIQRLVSVLYRDLD
ncbi:MAG: glycosyltransferase family 4 protein [Chloroflexota bacterium]